MAGNLTRYSYWQLRDFIRERGYALLITSTLLGFTLVMPLRAMYGANMGVDSAKQILILALPQVVPIAAFITLNGLVSTDRKLGYYKFLFSKPVSIPAYYAQYFIVCLVGFLLTFALLFGVFAFVVRPVNPIGALTYCALVYLSLGGIGFLISSLFRYDWPILAGVYLGSALLNQLWGLSEGWRHWVTKLLPPLHELSPALKIIMTTGSADTKSIVWLLGYSAIFFVAGLIVLWKRPIG